jgi:hypothetical protein
LSDFHSDGFFALLPPFSQVLPNHQRGGIGRECQ